MARFPELVKEKVWDIYHPEYYPKIDRLFPLNMIVAPWLCAFAWNASQSISGK